MGKIIYGKINDSFFDVHFYTIEKPQCPDGFVVMKSERPIDGDYIASTDGK